MEVSFPNEIWLEIFKRIERPKLMELRLVCHNFYDLIEDLLNKDPDWKELAFKGILYDCLEATMQRAYPYHLAIHHLEIHDPILWRGTYLSFKKWQKVLINSPTSDTIVSSSNFGNISCVSTFDKYIAVAFHKGLIATYTIDNISQPFYLTNHGTRVLQVEFWYSNADVLIVSVGEDHLMRFWDLQNKTEIATNGFFANSLIIGECRHFCIGERGGNLTSYDRVGNNISPGPTLNLELEGDEYVVAHVIDGKHMTAVALDDGGTILYLFKGVIEGGKLIELELQQKTDCYQLPNKLRCYLRRLTMTTITFFFGIGEISIGSINYYDDRWHEYNLSQYFGCNVVSIALQAQILMFGLEDGSIHLLHISNYSCVMELEERIKHSRKIEVDTKPIVDLIVLEVDKKPCIVAVTDQKIHLINFF